MNRGYAGYYKEFYLRSSYEYAYARYLDHFDIPWSYEDRIFSVNGKSYKPDFFIYNPDGALEKIVEVKSRNKRSIESALQNLKCIEEAFGLSTSLVSYKELLILYKNMPVSLNSVITNWILSEKTTISKSTRGELNAHFGIRHSVESKKRIGEHTKRLWESDSPSKQRMVEGLRKSGLVQKGKFKTTRSKRTCKRCNTEFTVLNTSSKKYCSRKCSGAVAIGLATERYVDNRNEVHRQIRIFIEEWTLKNADLVLSTPFNKINSTIKPMTDEILVRFQIKDFRVISKAVFGQDRGRKELLRYMKSICDENVC